MTEDRHTFQFRLVGSTDEHIKLIRGMLNDITNDSSPFGGVYVVQVYEDRLPQFLRFLDEHPEIEWNGLFVHIEDRSIESLRVALSIIADAFTPFLEMREVNVKNGWDLK